MKKKVLFLLGCFCLSFLIAPDVFAEQYIILNTNKSFRASPNSSGALLTNAVTDGVLLNGMRVTLLDANGGPAGGGCLNNWYKVSYNSHEGYICSSGQVIQETVEIDLNGDFEKEMLSKGFPESYLPYLKALHNKHPNWTFTPVKTNLDFNEAITNENIDDISVVDGTDESLRAVDSNGNFIPSKEAGWYVASRSTVQYYMDPRNFLSEEYIFMFENLSYNRDIHTRDAVSGVTTGTFLNTNEYLDLLMRAAKDYNVSPVYLASRIRQEKGTNGGIGTDGSSFTFAVDNECLIKKEYSDSNSWSAKNDCGSGLSYSGIYNFYNIGAYGYYQSPVIRGLIWANGGFDASADGYMRPWNSKEKAILGGADYITEKFIRNGQNTLYFQKFNVGPNATYPHYTHQYMTNVRAHASEAYSTYKSYRDNNLLNMSYEFAIPVFNNMGDEPTEIIPDEPDDTPEESADVLAVATAITSAGYKLNNNVISGVSLNKTTSSFESDLQRVYAKMQITNVSDKSNLLGTGKTLTITNGKETKDYTIVIYGDNNGDGKINVVDLLRVQKYILNSNNLSSVQLTASDTNRDGTVNVVDLLRIQKQILGSITIEQ